MRIGKRGLLGKGSFQNCVHCLEILENSRAIYATKLDQISNIKGWELSGARNYLASNGEWVGMALRMHLRRSCSRCGCFQKVSRTPPRRECDRLGVNPIGFWAERRISLHQKLERKVKKKRAKDQGDSRGRRNKQGHLKSIQVPEPKKERHTNINVFGARLREHSHGRVARGQTLMHYLQNPRKINYVARVPGRDDNRLVTEVIGQSLMC